MDSLEKLQKRLTTLGDLLSIVKTMKALSAASIRQYEQSVAALSSYQQTVERGLHVLVKDTYPLELTNKSVELQPQAAIIFGSDHGLCGRFNEIISEYALAHLADSQHGPVSLMAVGGRVAATLKNSTANLSAASSMPPAWQIDHEFELPSSTSAITRTVQEILWKVDHWQHKDKVGKITIFNNQRSKGQGYQPCQHVLLPVNLTQFKYLDEGKWPSRRLPTYSMAYDELLSKLIHQYLFVSLFRACAESQTSEHASRLAAMQSAQHNLDDHLSEVSKDYRHARQTEITTELLDIVSGFETIVRGK